MDNHHFPSHGRIDLKIEDGLLLIDAEGPINLEFMQQYKENILPYRKRLASASWASLTCLRGDPLLPLEARNILIASLKDAKKNGLVATAVILVNVEYSNSIIQFWTEIFNQCELNHQFFKDEAQAKAWLYEQIKLAS